MEKISQVSTFGKGNDELQEEQQKCQENQVFSCNERVLYRILMGYGFLVVFVFALIGNCLNLFIYNSDQIRYYIAIRMLCTKLLMNTLMMMLLVPQALRIINFWEPGSETDEFYWKFWPYQAYCVNLFGFCSMWLTVLMTGECYVHIFFPSQSKSVCTKKNVSRSYLIMIVAGMILALIYPLNRTVHLEKQCESVVVKIVASETFLMKLSERIHTVANLLLAILVPLSLLVFMTASIVWRLLIKTSDIRITSRFSAEKKSVTRITLITTVLQLITEVPSVPVFVYAGIFGPNIVNKNPQLCTWQTVSHFLGLCNASMSFFVYISFSDRFRSFMCRQLLFRNFCPRFVSRPAEISKMKTYTSFVSHTGTDRCVENPSNIRRPDILGISNIPNSASENLFDLGTETEIIISKKNGVHVTEKRHQIRDPSSSTTPSSVNDSFL
ncbi:hypothetical protein FO519_001782 [Halicephalobus sp. NKZ332]|nr:hypothetical protein FO519_001782 [Halicephalobus sp. NKZ332]